MTGDDIQGLKAGKKLNIFVSEKVMGNKVVTDPIMGDTEIFVTDNGETIYGFLTPYSEKPSSARLVVERMEKLGFPEAKLLAGESRPECWRCGRRW